MLVYIRIIRFFCIYMARFYILPVFKFQPYNWTQRTEKARAYVSER